MTRTISYGIPMCLRRERGVSDDGRVERRGERLGLVVGRRRARDSDRRRSTGMDRVWFETVRKGFPLHLPPTFSSSAPSLSASNQSILVFGVGTIGLLACTLTSTAVRSTSSQLTSAPLVKRNAFDDNMFYLPNLVV